MKNYLPLQKKLNVEYFRALMAVAMADGKLKKAEIDFFRSKANELGFPINSVQEMLSTELEDINKMALFEIDEIDFISDIVAMAMIDGEIHEKEYELCINLAKRKGHTQQEVDDTIKWLNELESNNKKTR